jgi:hypothetical protein
MDTVTILRDLWRRRMLVLGVYVFSLLIGTLILYKISFPPKLESRKYEVGVATQRILVDTPSSQVVEIAPKGSDLLGVRANLLASLMVDGTVKDAIARRAGVNPDDLVGISTSVTDQPINPPADHNAPVMTTKVVTDNDGSELPIIQIDTQASTVGGATRLANAAVAGLRDYLDSKAAAQRIPDVKRLQVEGLGPPQAHTAARGPSRAIAVAAVLFIFGLGCGCILAVLALVRGWRDADARENAEVLDVTYVEPPVADAETVPEYAVADDDVEEDWSEPWPAAPVLVITPPADGDEPASEARTA